jgi:serine/threonine-protein phosphatase PGAM5
MFRLVGLGSVGLLSIFPALPQSDTSTTTTWNSHWDGLSHCIQTNTPSCQRPAKVHRHILLVRHGQYFTDSEHKSLTPLGKTQANLTAKRIADILKGKGKIYRGISSSTMTRAIETAEIVRSEIGDGQEEGMKVHEVLCEGKPIEPDPARKLGENVHWETERMEKAFRMLFYRSCDSVCLDGKEKEDDEVKVVEEYQVVVAHANVIRYLVLRALQLDPKAWLRLSLHHASITWIRISPSGSVSLRALGDYGHIPEELATTR